MAEVITYQRFWMRRDTEANWAAANPVLAAGEFGVVLDGAGNPLAMKMGDGVTAWLSLPYLSSPMVVLAGGTADALTATFDPVPVLYDGLVVPVRAAAANTTAATLAVNGGTARAITKQGGTALSAGDIAAAGHELLLRYRASVPRWELLNPAAGGSGGGQAAIQFKDEGSNIGSSGAITSVNFTGSGVTATAVGTAVTVAVSGGSSSYPPGSADAPPSSPNAKDDEFDGTSSVTWTATPTAPNATDVGSTRTSHLRIFASGSGSTLVGRYQPAPGSFPYTVRAKFTTSGGANYHRSGGIILLPASPTSSTAATYCGDVYVDQSTGQRGVQRVAYSSMSAYASESTPRFSIGQGQYYIKVVMTSATAAAIYASVDGWAWKLIQNYTVPYSVANIGLACTEEGAGGTVEMYSDWFRVT